MGVDWGRRRIGIAISDPNGIIAQPFEVVTVRRPGDEWARLLEICAQFGVSRIVLGLPLDTDGNEGPAAREVRRWGTGLARRTGCEVIYRDERLSSAQATRTARATGKTARTQRRMLDALAAQTILDAWLREQTPKSEMPPAP